VGRVIPFPERYDRGSAAPAERCSALLQDAMDLREQLLGLPKPHRSSASEYMVESTSTRMLLNDIRGSLSDLARAWKPESDQARGEQPARAKLLLDIDRVLGLVELRVVLLCGEVTSSEFRLNAARDLEVLVPRLAEALRKLPQVMGVPAWDDAKPGCDGTQPSPANDGHSPRRGQIRWRAGPLSDGPHAS
jgi:hypothetical protein